MDRRKFFSNLLGAAAVAAIPPSILNALPKSPLEEKISAFETKVKNRSLELAGKPIPQLDIDRQKFALLYKSSQLIGYSHDFNLTTNRQLIDVTKDPRFLADYEGFPEYIQGPLSWDLTLNNILMYSNPWGLINRGINLSLVLKDENVVLEGDCIISGVASFDEDSLPMRCYLELAGNGALTANISIPSYITKK